MIIKCGACKADIEIPGGITDGTHIRCPYCNEKTIYSVSSSGTELGHEIPSVKPKLHVRRPNGNSGVAPVRMTRVGQNEAMGDSVARTKEKKSSVGVIVIAVVALCGLVFGLVQYNKYMRQKAAREQEELRLQEQGRIKAAQEAEERAKRMAEEDAERERKRKEAEAERARRKAEADAERERKRLEREKELQEQKEKAEAEKANRERIEDVERKFKSASIVFASDFAVDKSPIRRDGTFYAIGLEYISDQKVYEAMVERGVVVAVRAFSTRGEPTDVEAKTFTDNIMKNRLLVMGEDGVAWICGTGKSSWTEKVSIANEDVTPAKTELGELFAILSKWGRLPNLKYRLTLKSSKNGVLVKGGKEIPLGIIEYAAAIASDRIRDAILKPLQKKRESSADIKPPKLKKFTPTVVFYDGDIIRKELKVTKVPRTFKHLGTKVYGTIKNRTYEQAEEQWRQLKEEAERQERRKEEIIQENAQAMREHEEKIREILNKGISGEQIEAEAQKYLLLIERSRSRLPS